MIELEFKILLNEKLCDLADAILYHYNPCRLTKDNTCLVKENKNETCCHNSVFGGVENKTCIFIKDNKCGFRNIGCKVWLCATAIIHNPECANDLKDIENLAKRYGLVRRPFLGDRYVGRSAELAANRDINE